MFSWGKSIDLTTTLADIAYTKESKETYPQEDAEHHIFIDNSDGLETAYIYFEPQYQAEDSPRTILLTITPGQIIGLDGLPREVLRYLRGKASGNLTLKNFAIWSGRPYQQVQSIAPVPPKKKLKPEGCTQ